MTSVRRFSRALPVQRRVRGDLGVGDGDPGEVGPGPALGVPVGRVDRDAEPGGRLRPLVLEVLGRRDDGERGDLAPGQQFGRDGERVGGLARSRRRDQQEVPPGRAEILVVGILLPAAKTKQKIIPNGWAVSPGDGLGGGGSGAGREAPATAWVDGSGAGLGEPGHGWALAARRPGCEPRRQAGRGADRDAGRPLRHVEGWSRGRNVTGKCRPARAKARRAGPARRTLSPDRRRPGGAARRSPCRWGRPGNASGPGWAPTPCRRARPGACP